MCSSSIGIWPYVYENNLVKHQLYNIYAKFIFFYFISYIITSYMKLFSLLLAENINVHELVENLCITLLYSLTTLRVFIIKTEDVKALIRQVMSMEKVIYKSRDEEVIDIYKMHVRQSHISNIIFITNISLQIIIYCLHPLYESDTIEYNKATNTTRVIKPFPLSSWFPYDPQEHYLSTYLWHMFDLSLGGFYVMFTDSFTFSLMIFPLGQIKILIHLLRNFDKYALKTQEQFGYERDEASFLTLRECILKHKEIISYIEVYNGAMKNAMVLDFLASSLQLASILIRLLVSEFRFFSLIFHGEFTICMLLRLLVSYGCANEIMLQSSNVGMAIWESKWYEQSPKLKQMMLMMIMRSNKPLVLEIGSFGTMTWSAFLGILKATYSYIMIIYK